MAKGFFSVSELKIKKVKRLLVILVLLAAGARFVPASADTAAGAAANAVKQDKQVKTPPPSITTWSPGISITPASHDFGNVTIGTSQRTIFTISNAGTTDLVVSSIYISADDPSEFGIESGTCKGDTPTIEAGKNCTVAVTFTATSPGKRSARIEVSSSSPVSAILGAALTATGVQPAPEVKPAVPEVKPAVPAVKPAVPAVKPAPVTVQPAAPQGKTVALALTVDRKSPVLRSAGKVTFTPHAEGGSGTCEYKFWLKGPSTGDVWVEVRDYSTSPFSWTPLQSGSYTIWVYARGAGNSAVCDGSAWMPYDVVDNPPVASVALTADKTSPALRSAAETVTFTPHAEGGSGTCEYKFWLKGPSTGNVWTVVHNYDTAATFSWTPSQAGSYAIWVEARNTGSPARSEASGWMPFDVVDKPPVASVVLTSDKPSPEAKTTVGSVTFRPRANGGSGTYEYEFWLKGPSTGSAWTVVQAYGLSDTFTWQPSQPGSYLVAVYARNAGSPAGHEAVNGLAFEILDR